MRWRVVLGVGIAATCGALAYHGMGRSSRHDPIIPTPDQQGVVYHDPERAQQGHYVVVQNMVYDAECSVYEPDGRFVHRFPGHYCVFPKAGGIVTLIWPYLVYFDNEMREVWRHGPLDIHHDIFVDDIRNEIAVLMRIERREKGRILHDDGVKIFDLTGKEVFSWIFNDNFKEVERAYGRSINYRWHDSMESYVAIGLNSVQILPPNRVNHPAFAEGNILLNDTRNSFFLILDRSGRIVWIREKDSNAINGGHSPRLNPDGTILYLKNREKWVPPQKELEHFIQAGDIVKNHDGYWVYGPNRCSFRGAKIFNSAVEEFDVSTGKNTWSYRAKEPFRFCAYELGHTQRLPNGNILVSHISNGGAAFEITREGEIVWEWVSPLKDPKGHRGFVYKVYKVPRERVDRLL